jgi:hypothetical protein
LGESKLSRDLPENVKAFRSVSKSFFLLKNEPPHIAQCCTMNMPKVKIKKPLTFSVNGFFVRKKGLEPPRREAPDPKSGAATNYATSAVRIFLRVAKIA